MSIIARCEGCQKSYQVPDELAGKRKRCKACGHVVTIPAREAASPSIPEDDDLIPLAPAGAEGAPRPAARVMAPPPLPRPGVPAAQPPMRGLGHAPPPPAAGAPVPAAPGYGSPAFQPSAYVTLANEAVIDRYLPFTMVGLFVAFVVVLASQGVSRTLEYGQHVQAGPEAMSRGVGYVIGFALGYTAGVAAIAAPLCLLGVFVASRVMKFPNRPHLYWRCLATVCGTTALTGLAALALGATTPAAEVVSWALGIPLLIAALWFLLRLRPAPFAVTAGFVVLFTVLLPTALFYGVMRTGGSASGAGGRFASGGNSAGKRTDAQALQEAIEKARAFHPEPTDRDLTSRPSRPYYARSEPDAFELEMLRRQETQLRQVGKAVAEYARAHANRFPETWGDMIEAGLLPHEEFAAKSYYGLTPARGLKFPAPAKLIIFHHDLSGAGKYPCLFGDGHVESIESVRWDEVRRESDEALRDTVEGPGWRERERARVAPPTVLPPR